MKEAPKRVDQLSSSPSDSVKSGAIDWRDGRNGITKPSGAKALLPTQTTVGVAPVNVKGGR